jgi:hypothetical protein
MSGQGQYYWLNIIVHCQDHGCQVKIMDVRARSVLLAEYHSPLSRSWISGQGQYYWLNIIVHCQDHGCQGKVSTIG